MAISKELRLGTIAILTIAVMIWGYKFLKGQKLFSESMVLHSTFSDVYQLSVSSPVYLNGLKIGNVTEIAINRANVQEMTVYYYIEGDYGIPNDATCVMINEGLVGGRAIAIEYDYNCTQNCAMDGDKLDSSTQGLLESMVPKEEINEYVEAFKVAISDAMGQDSSAAIANSMGHLETTIANLSNITASLDQVLAQSAKNLNNTMANIDRITNNLAANEDQINDILANINAMTADLKAANISSVVQKADLAMDNANTAITAVEQTISQSGETIDQLKSLLTELQSGEGSFAMMVNDPELYNNLEATSENLSLLLQDLRLNPKRYVNVSVFGKKSKSYTLPEDDPAYKE